MNSYTSAEWCQQRSLELDINYMMADFLGQEGIEFEQLHDQRFSQAAQSLQEKRGSLEWRDLPYSQGEIVQEILEYAAWAKDQFTNFVVLGIGGSALGPIAVHQALNHYYYNELPRDKRNGFPRFYVVDNVDPERFTALLDILDPEETLFNVITKSGSTSETMAQFMIIRSMLQNRLGDKFHRNLVATTDREKGNLIKIAKQENYKLFYIPKGVGGRFSQLCPVGLLPAAMSGIDIRELLAGAAYMDRWTQEPELLKNPAYLRAALQYLALTKGKNISVMMPYADSLKYMADWFAQLWAESLGKRIDLQGKEVFAGQTPVKALGVTDQHSQVQLYTEGPYDKVVNFLAVGKFRQRVNIPQVYSDIPAVAFLGGHSLNELMEAERRATEYALYRAGRLNNTIYLPEVNPFTIGQLIYLLEVETAYMGELLRINAYDQPGVEEGKNATYALLGRPGYEAKKAELEGGSPKLGQYILNLR